MQKQLSQSLNSRQMAVLTANSPSVADILDNEEFMEELNEEIEYTYEQPAAAKPKEPKMTERVVRKLPEPSLKALDPEAELDEMNKLAEIKIAKKREQEQKDKEEAPEPSREQTPEEALRGQILGALKEHKSAPSEGDIARWKREHGENGVYVLALNEEDVFVFTYIRRGHWQKIQQTIANAQKADLTQNPDDMLKEKVLQFTVLWPRPLTIEFFVNSRAGTIDTLFNVIMANSSFLQLNQAMVLTTQL